jgi:hypothetical protein
VATLGCGNLRAFETQICGVWNSTDGHETVRTFDNATVCEGYLNVVALVDDTLGT